tara:strand:+ start:244 stop:492 length:249 start_codon:yes stop_codon:yes gene_type:complete
MPRYNYQCKLCKKSSTINHHSDDLPGGCPLCKEEGGLVKILTTFSTQQKTSSVLRTGQITEEFIKDSREELKQQRKQLDEER